MAQKIKTIVLDVDDTLLGYQKGLREYVNQYYGYEITGYPDNYSLRGWIPEEEYKRMQMLKRFNKSWQFGCLEPLDGAVEAVNKINEYNSMVSDPIEMIVLTKCGTDPITTALRKANLTQVFGIVFSEVIVIDGDESKKHYLKKLKRHRDILLSVDDHVGNALDMASINVPVVVIERPHNKDVSVKYPSLKVAPDWETILADFIEPLYTQGK